MGGEAKPPLTNASPDAGRSLWFPLRAFARMSRQASSDWIDDNASRLGAAVAFYILLSLAPVIVIAVALSAVVYGQAAAEGRLASELGGVAGPEVARTIQENHQRRLPTSHKRDCDFARPGDPGIWRLFRLRGVTRRPSIPSGMFPFPLIETTPPLSFG